MRAVGIDLGSKRIGIATAPADVAIAVPAEVLQRSGDPDHDMKLLTKAICDIGAEVVVVGLPVSMDGSEGPAARSTRQLAAQLQTALEANSSEVATCPRVELHDERLTTVSAQRLLSQRGISHKDQRQMVDSVAAAVILQSWLDSQ